MTPEQRAREFVEVGFRDLGVPSLEPYIKIVADLIVDAETDLRAEVERLRAESEAFRGKLAEQCGQTLVARAEIERLTAIVQQHEIWQASLVQQLVDKDAEIARLRAGLQILAKQEYDRGYTPEGFAEVILSGDEPCSTPSSE